MSEFAPLQGPSRSFIAEYQPTDNGLPYTPQPYSVGGYDRALDFLAGAPGAPATLADLYTELHDAHYPVARAASVIEAALTAHVARIKHNEQQPRA